MKKRVLLGTGIVVGVILVASGIWLYCDTKPAAAPPDTSQKTTPASGKDTADQTINLALPGADAIPAREENYDVPSSLWVVVNKDHALSDPHFRPSDLTRMTEVSRTDKSDDERSLSAVAVEDFTAMLAAAKQAGYDLIIGSGFRSYELQATYYNHYVATSGEEAANKYSAKPGYSEHQTGLVADLTTRSMECYLDTCFGETPAGQWLAKYAAEYGFIIRYPADKTAITQYQYEPWHIRYVGKPLAKALAQSGLTLDEAYPYLQTAKTNLLAARKINE